MHAKKRKERGQYSAFLTKQAWSVKDLLDGFQEQFSGGTHAAGPK